MEGLSIEAQTNQQDADRRDSAHQKHSRQATTGTPGPQVTHALKKNGVENGGERGCVVGKQPRLNAHAGGEYARCQQKKSDALITKCTGECQQRYSESEAEVEGLAQ